MATDRYRLKYVFWLEPDKREHEIVADQIERLKNERSFAGVVRDGIMIISELRQGKIDLLLKTFPWIADEILRRTSPVETDLQRELEELKHLIRDQSKSAHIYREEPLTSPKSLLSKVHVEEEIYDQLVMRKAKSDGSSSKNFLDSAFDLVQ